MKKPTVSSWALTRVIVFAKNAGNLADFYCRIFGARERSRDPDGKFIELDTGGCRLAIHKGSPPKSQQGMPKLVFGTRDVEGTREELIRRGATLGRVIISGELHLCDGRDPEGNVFQLSNRP
jgi:hypothetical protein